MKTQRFSQASLYDRLGGGAGITAIVTGLYERLLADPRIGGFWKGHSNDSKAREIKSVIDFMCHATGGSLGYSGRDMQTSHEGLVIDEADWAVFSELATQTMIDNGVGAGERAEVLSFFNSFKSELAIKQRPDIGKDEPTLGRNGLTRREQEVLGLVAAGKSNPEIAKELYISLNTVTRHLSNIFHKTGTINRVEAALYAARHGLS